MNEKDRADIYIAYLNKILSGEKDIGFTDDIEIDKLLSLARTMLAADLSGSSEIKEKLRNQLLVQIIEKNKSGFSVLLKNDGELDDDILDHVAAGFAGHDEEQNYIINRITLPDNPENKG